MSWGWVGMGSYSLGHCSQTDLDSPWAAGVWQVLQAFALVAPVAGPC